MNEAITIGVVAFNEEEQIETCLRSLHFIYELNPVEIILVDNASTDNTVEVAEAYLKSWGRPYRIVKRQSNNMASARNDVFRYASHRWVYMIDADCYLGQSTWKKLLSFWVDNPRIAAYGGSQDFPQDTEMLVLIDQFRQTFLGNFGSVQMMPPQEKFENVEHVSTSHVLYDAKAWKVVGGFNDQLSEAAEDLDFSLRLRRHGFRLKYVASSFVWHRQVDSWIGWYKKAFRNGIWQTRLLAYNREMFYSLRPWPGLLAPIVLLWPSKLLEFIFIAYFISVAFLVLRAPLELYLKPKLFWLFLSTHFLYAAGEICGVALALRDRIRAPSSTKS